MIVITDGESHDSPDLEKVIRQSEKDNVTRYAVAVSPAPALGQLAALRGSTLKAPGIPGDASLAKTQVVSSSEEQVECAGGPVFHSSNV